MKISNSKKELARIISENGGWREGADTCSCDHDGYVSFFVGNPTRNGGSWLANGDCEYIGGTIATKYEKIKNWHQTILSREEYFHLYPTPDADGWIEWKGGECPVDDDCMVVCKILGGELWDGGAQTKAGHMGWRHDGFCDIIAYRLHKQEQAEPQYCESVTRSIPEPIAAPTIDRLLQDWRYADDYAKRKQAEADEAAAMRDERWRAVQAKAGEIGVTVGKRESAEAESNLVITDYHQLCVGDVLRCKDLPAGAKCNVGDEGVIVKAENSPLAGGVYVNVGGRDWFGVFGEHWEFIRRP